MCVAGLVFCVLGASLVNLCLPRDASVVDKVQVECEGMLRLDVQ